MKKVLLFAGTSEGRLLAEALRDLPVEAVVCAATEYGREMLAGVSGRFAVLAERMDADAMRSLIVNGGFDWVLDATHPYAVDASANIRRAAELAGVPCLRVARRESPKHSCDYVDSAAAAARRLAELPGRVLLATGAKELSVYTEVPGYAERLYPRVLPTLEAIGECLRLGFRRSHVIAMQGPFSRELNLAMLRQFGIAVMATKDGGAAGGFPEKMLAAEEAGVRVVVIGRPAREHGLSLEETLAVVRRGLEAKA